MHKYGFYFVFVSKLYRKCYAYMNNYKVIRALIIESVERSMFNLKHLTKIEIEKVGVFCFNVYWTQNTLKRKINKKHRRRPPPLLGFTDMTLKSRYFLRLPLYFYYFVYLSLGY